MYETGETKKDAKIVLKILCISYNIASSFGFHAIFMSFS